MSMYVEVEVILLLLVMDLNVALFVGLKTLYFCLHCIFDAATMLIDHQEVCSVYKKLGFG